MARDDFGLLPVALEYHRFQSEDQIGRVELQLQLCLTGKPSVGAKNYMNVHVRSEPYQT